MLGFSCRRQDSVGTQCCLAFKRRNKTKKKNLALIFLLGFRHQVAKQTKVTNKQIYRKWHFSSLGQTLRRLSVAPSVCPSLAVCLLLPTQPGDLGSNLSGACPSISLSTSSIRVQQCRGNRQKLRLGQSLLSLGATSWSGRGGRGYETPRRQRGTGWRWGEGQICLAVPSTSLNLEVLA